MALNVAMDLQPFRSIDPCGYPGLRVTQLSDWIPDVSLETVQDWLVAELARCLDMSARILK